MQNAFLLISHPCRRPCTRAPRHQIRARERGCCQRICIACKPLLAPRPHFAAPRARRAPTFRHLMEMPTFRAECVVNRSLPAFHFWSESIGLCRSQHLIKGWRVNWSLNRDTRRCMGGLFVAPLHMRRHTSGHGGAFSFPVGSEWWTLYHEGKKILTNLLHQTYLPV